MTINQMTDEQYAAREGRVRARARRQGLVLRKSRSRDPRAVQHGTYMLLDGSTNAVVASGLANGYGLDLDEVEAALAEG